MDQGLILLREAIYRVAIEQLKAEQAVARRAPLVLPTPVTRRLAEVYDAHAHSTR
jgi:hypothetical protein